MIGSFADRDTEQLFYTGQSRRFSGIAKPAMRKLHLLEDATRLDDLKQPAGNRLEALKGGRKGQYSIRVNDQYRICFRWTTGPRDVEIVDYH